MLLLSATVDKHKVKEYPHLVPSPKGIYQSNWVKDRKRFCSLVVRIRGHCAGARPDLSLVGSVGTGLSCHRRWALDVRTERTSRFVRRLHSCRVIESFTYCIYVVYILCMYVTAFFRIGSNKFICYCSDWFCIENLYCVSKC